MDAGSVTEERAVQFANADTPIDVTPAGMFTDSRLLHPLNAELPID